MCVSRLVGRWVRDGYGDGERGLDMVLGVMGREVLKLLRGWDESLRLGWRLLVLELGRVVLQGGEIFLGQKLGVRVGLLGWERGRGRWRLG